MVRIGTVVMGASDVRRAAAFWTAALGYVEREPATDDWVVLAPADGQGVGLSLGLSESPVQEVPRVHLDLYTQEQDAEVERLLTLGAARVDWQLYPQDPDFVVLADTEETASASSTPRTADRVGRARRRKAAGSPGTASQAKPVLGAAAPYEPPTGKRTAHATPRTAAVGGHSAATG